LLEFDLLLDETTSLVPENMRSLVQSLPPETLSEPKQRLDEILKDAVADRRDRRLIRFISELLRNQSNDLEKTFDLAAEAISGFSDTDVKSAYTDRLTIARVDELVRQKKIIEAQQLFFRQIISLIDEKWFRVPQKYGRSRNFFIAALDRASFLTTIQPNGECGCRGEDGNQ
jgi:hypothetical protein